MIDIHDLLRRSRAGDSVRHIARATTIDRKTVTRYLNAARAILPSPACELTDEWIAAIQHEVQDRRDSGAGAKIQQLQPHRERIRSWLEHPQQPLRLIRILELLSRDGVNVSYTTLRRFARDEFGFGQQPNTVRIDEAGPGEEAQVDFALMGKVNFNGMERKLWVFIVTLVYSRYSFVWPTLTQTTQDVVNALEAAWRHFGGVAHRVIPDNATSRIVRADRHHPKIGKTFHEYATSRGFFIDPARVQRPQDKARVENHVPYVRERWFAGEHWTSLEQTREHAAQWSREIAGMRVHGTTRRRPFEVYEAVEQKQMLPPPDAPYDTPQWRTAKVHRDHHFQVDQALYSVPTAHIGHQVDIRLTAVTVMVYHNEQLIATHARAQAGERKTNPEHYPQHKRAYATRRLDELLSQAQQCGAHIGAFMQHLVDGEFAWTKMRQAASLLRLMERYGQERLDAACAIAISYEVFDVQRLRTRISSAVKQEDRAIDRGQLVRLPTRFARASERFATMARSSSNPTPEDRP